MFRLLETIAILLPLTAILLQLSTRLPEVESVRTDRDTVNAIQLALFASSLSMVAAGLVTVIVLILILDSFGARVVLAMLYIAFITLGVSLTLLWAVLNPSYVMAVDQQKLSGWELNDADE